MGNKNVLTLHGLAALAVKLYVGDSGSSLRNASREKLHREGMKAAKEKRSLTAKE